MCEVILVRAADRSDSRKAGDLDAVEIDDQVDAKRSASSAVCRGGLNVTSSAVSGGEMGCEKRQRLVACVRMLNASCRVGW